MPPDYSCVREGGLAPSIHGIYTSPGCSFEAGRREIALRIMYPRMCACARAFYRESYCVTYLAFSPTLNIAVGRIVHVLYATEIALILPREMNRGYQTQGDFAFRPFRNFPRRLLSRNIFISHRYVNITSFSSRKERRDFGICYDHPYRYQFYISRGTAMKY